MVAPLGPLSPSHPPSFDKPVDGVQKSAPKYSWVRDASKDFKTKLLTHMLKFSPIRQKAIEKATGLKASQIRALDDHILELEDSRPRTIDVGGKEVTLFHDPEKGTMIFLPGSDTKTCCLETGATYTLEVSLEEVEDKTELSKDEIQTIKAFVDKNRSSWEEAGETRHIRKDGTNQLPRSLIFIPGKGAFILLKEHGDFKKLGGGSYKKVTLAYNLDDGKMYAYGSSADVKGIPQNERDIALHFAKPEYRDYIVGGHAVVYKSKKGEDKVGMMMPLAGMDLEKMDERKGFIMEDRIRILRHLAKGLKMINDEGVVHRDLKGANVLMVDGKPKISDFGFAMKVDEQDKGRYGTPSHASPEQLQGRDLTCKSDIFSFGCLLGALLYIGDQHDPLGRGELGDAFSKYEKRREANDDLTVDERMEYIEIDEKLFDPQISRTQIEDKLKEISEDEDCIGKAIFLRCCQFDPDNRPTIDEVITMIEELPGNLYKEGTFDWNAWGQKAENP